jgi:hypothetical protein
MSCREGSHEPRIPPDDSLTPYGYRQLGFPPVEAKWSENERTRARSVLRNLAAERPNQLPRFASESSGAVFAKLLHEEFDRRGDFEGEFGSALVSELEGTGSDELAHLIQGDTLEGIYAPESTGGLLFDREIVQFASKRLAKVVALRSDLQASFAEVPVSPSRGHDLAARYHELLQINERVLVQLLANITAFAVAERFTRAARSDATSRLAENLREIAPLLSAEAQAELRGIIQEASASPDANPELDEISVVW